MHSEQAWDHLGSIEEKNDMILQDIWDGAMMAQKYCRYKLIKIIQDTTCEYILLTYIEVWMSYSHLTSNKNF